MQLGYLMCFVVMVIGQTESNQSGLNLEVKISQTEAAFPIGKTSQMKITEGVQESVSVYESPKEPYMETHNKNCDLSMVPENSFPKPTESTTKHIDNQPKGNQKDIPFPIKSKPISSSTGKTADLSYNKQTVRSPIVNDIQFQQEPEIPLLTRRIDKCYDINAPGGLCPDDLIEDKPSKLCYTIKEYQQFPPDCPYPHFLPYHNIKQIIKHFYDKTIWVRAIRNVMNGFPDMEWFENGLLYGKIVEENINNLNTVNNTNCLVTKYGRLTRVSCLERHATLCAYSPLRLLTPTSICPGNCIFSNYQLTRPTCFCETIQFLGIKKNKFCKKLAEPIHPFQTELLSNGFKSNKCWIGLYKDTSQAGLYKWSSTGQNVSYTNWAKSERCVHSEGAIRFSADPELNGWILARDRTLTCAICEVIPHFSVPTLTLKYFSAEKTIKLIISNPDTISNYYGYDIYCFSDSHYNFKDKVKYDPHRSEIEIAEDRPGFYWCEAFQVMSSHTIKSNSIVAFKKIHGYGHEFSVVTVIKIQSEVDPFFNNIHKRVCNYLKDSINKKYDMVSFLRPLRGYFNEISLNIHLLIHITTKITSESPTTQHTKLTNALVEAANETISIMEVFSSHVCLPITSKTLDNQIIEWPETRIGATAIPYNKLCLDENVDMLPVIRKCEGDFLHGGRWGEIIGSCTNNTEYSEITEKLFWLATIDISAEYIINELKLLTQHHLDTLIDVYLVATILKRLVNMPGEKDCSNYTTIISNLMDNNIELLKEAQLLLNSTDIILASLDDLLKNENPISIITPNLIVEIDYLDRTQGIALYAETTETNNFEQYTVKKLLRYHSLDIKNKQLQTAVFFPNNLARKADSGEAKVITVFYNNEALFNELNRTHIKLHQNKIIGISIPNLIESLDIPITIFFRMPHLYINNTNCFYWNYGLDLHMASMYGNWQIDGASQENNILQACHFSHLTHFGLFLTGSAPEEYHDRPLEIITLIGSSLTLIGIIPIFITGIVIKRWRRRPRNIILINFCIAITAQVILTFVVNGVKSNGVLCKLVGVGLHYTILSEFCWMFVTALLQYRRVVIALNSKEKNILKRGLLIGWCLPLAPVIITLSISPRNYHFNEHNFCYMSGRYLTYGLQLPIVIILSINGVIFIKMIYTISRLKVPTGVGKKRKHKLEILLAVLLFFVLGMSWIFGFTGMLGGGVVFTYIFCITATLRGLVLFLFFIAGNKETRLMWRKRSKRVLKKNVERLKDKHIQVN